ncbi:BRI1 kinase inhibitor 1-like [Canna indica]|uniref:BRI1 kinase inhibitor 1-like n=1 Tax=Canna indica TaxID=4628 RepID=A0AAQ3K200_9LILI|nr:BRI1 kinase inhibitor 1-like [Canna indica]
MDGIQKLQIRGREKKEEKESSATNSPSHDFSFTVSLSSPPNPSLPCDKIKPSSTFDLAPADDIFLHGHLLPFHRLSQYPTVLPPRPSNFSVDETLNQLPHIHGDRSLKQYPQEKKMRDKTSKSIISSFFGLGKTRKESDLDDREKKSKKRFKDMSRFWRKYGSAVERLFFFRGGEKEIKRGNNNERRRPCSFSGNHSSNHKLERDGLRKKGRSSAPGSMGASPTNSGLLSAAAGMAFSSSDESTMEELQSAIQAAIAHCKNSIAMEKEKCK